MTLATSLVPSRTFPAAYRLHVYVHVYTGWAKKRGT